MSYTGEQSKLFLLNQHIRAVFVAICHLQLSISEIKYGKLTRTVVLSAFHIFALVLSKDCYTSATETYFYIKNLEVSKISRIFAA